MKKIILTIALMAPLYAVAGICNYTPSKQLGAGATSAVGVGAGATAATGIGMKTAGLYAITHSTSGAVMLGSTAAGASAAGTTGIIAGSAGIIGSVGAALMSPFVIIPTAIVAGAVVVYEGSCYFSE